MLAVFTWNQEELGPSRQLCGSGLPYHQKIEANQKPRAASIPLVFVFCIVFSYILHLHHQALGAVS